jgi:hypothetical protein
VADLGELSRDAAAMLLIEEHRVLGASPIFVSRGTSFATGSHKSQRE